MTRLHEFTDKTLALPPPVSGGVICFSQKHAGSSAPLDGFEFVGEVVFEVPLLGGVEGDFEADEEAVRAAD